MLTCLWKKMPTLSFSSTHKYIQNTNCGDSDKKFFYGAMSTFQTLRCQNNQKYSRVIIFFRVF